MQISLVIPVKFNSKMIPSAVQQLSEHIQNQDTFWKKFANSVELIFVIENFKGIESHPWETLKKKFDSPSNRVQFLLNKKKLGRSQSIWNGLKIAQNQFVGIISEDLSLPLGESLLCFYELIETHHRFGASLIIANRKSTKKPYRRIPRRLRDLSEDIQIEKAKALAKKLNIADPTSPYLFMDSLALRRIIESNCQFQFRSWHYSPTIIQAAAKSNIHIFEKDVSCQDFKPSQIQLWSLFQ